MTPPNRKLALILVFLSGLSGLAYEVTWVRELSLIFGVSVYAVTAVLTAFMGGLALGSALFAPLAARSGAPLRLYAGLQCGIGLFAVLTPLLFRVLPHLYVALGNELLPNLLLFNLLRFGLATVVLLVPATLMGGSFPAISQYLARDSRSHGRDLGLLYAMNTLGGVVGTLGTGLFAIRFLGAQKAIFLAAAIDLAVVALAAWAGQRVGRWHDQNPPAPETTPGLDPALPVARTRSRRALRQIEGRARAVAATLPTDQELQQRARAARLVLWAFAGSGFVALGYEVLWTRLLSIFSLNTVYSFTIMLSTFLLGVALGSMLIGRRVDRSSRPLALFGYIQLGIGLLAILTLYVFAKLPSILTSVSVVSLRSQVGAELLAGVVTMLLPTLLIGATFPVAARIYANGTDCVAGQIGRLYSINTIGATAGSFVAGFALIPLLGLQRGVLLLAMVNLAMGVGALLAEGRPGWPAGALLVGAAIAALLLPPGIYLGFREGTSEHLVFYREGVDATVSVFEVKDPPLKVSFVNGRSEVPTDRHSMGAFRLLGHLPALLQPQAKSALMVSFGNGIATGTLARHRIAQIKAVEIVAEQREAARLYAQENHDVLDYPGLQITIEDGRNYLLRSQETFDIITADATHPINSSSWALFTSEFYSLARSHLAPDGVMIQWLPFHDLAEGDFRDIIKTFQSVFPHTTLWFTGGTHSFLVGTPTPLTRADILALQPLIDKRGVGDDLHSAQRLAEDLLMEEAEVREYTADATVVSDDRAFFIPARDMERIVQSFDPYLRLANDALR